MTDYTTLTLGGTANATSPAVTIRSDINAHSVEWTANSEINSLGPYIDSEGFADQPVVGSCVIHR